MSATIQFVRPEQGYTLGGATPSAENHAPEEEVRSPEETRWWREAQAEVDAICTALKDWMPRA